jgi:HSP20 family protein
MAFWNRELLPMRWGERSHSPLVDVDELFDRFRKDFFAPEQFRGIGEGFMPRVEMKETEKNILVSAELPGMNEKDITVTLRENNLILEGERKSEKKREEKGYYSSEFNFGNFYRSIPLYSEVDADTVEARYKDGILEVTLRKLEESKQNAKRIQIKH